MAFSAKLFEIVVYPESYDLTKLDTVFENNAIKDYAWIIHNQDNNKVHCHITIRTIDSRSSEYVAKWFEVEENAVNRVKSKRWADMLKYLTHRNAPEKHQYDDEEVQSNFDWKLEIEKQDQGKRSENIIENIVNGNIREYNYYEYINEKEYVKFKKQIDIAFQYRKDKIRGEKRNMDCIYITGDSGVGKTTYAKMICEEKKLSYFISSGSNDVLDGYKGQDVIILDDLRPSCMGLSDLLKMLDNNTSSSVKSRYINKVLECRMIIITSVLQIDTFFSNVFSEEKETVIQIKRRCKTCISMKTDYMDIYIYDDYIRGYDEPITAKNPISNLYKPKRLTREEQKEKAKNILGNVELTEFVEISEDNQENMSIFDDK
jgi:hypothetical protein